MLRSRKWILVLGFILTHCGEDPQLVGPYEEELEQKGLVFETEMAPTEVDRPVSRKSSQKPMVLGPYVVRSQLESLNNLGQSHYTGLVEGKYKGHFRLDPEVRLTGSSRAYRKTQLRKWAQQVRSTVGDRTEVSLVSPREVLKLSDPSLYGYGFRAYKEGDLVVFNVLVGSLDPIEPRCLYLTIEAPMAQENQLIESVEKLFKQTTLTKESPLK